MSPEIGKRIILKEAVSLFSRGSQTVDERPFFLSGAWRQFSLVRMSSNADLKVTSIDPSVWRDDSIVVTIKGEIYLGLLNILKSDTLCDITEQI